MRTRMLGALSAIALVLGAAGCGSTRSYQNAARPPAPISISVALANRRVEVSPGSVGAGPAVLLIANESGRTRDLTITGPGGRGGSCVADDASSGPINPQGTARVQVPLVEGTCRIGVAGGRLAPARLTVGSERPSAQQDLLQP